jgi:type I restriction enzyme S subunit
MSEWKEVAFSELLVDESISYGIVQPGSHSEENSVPIIRVNNIKNGNIATNDVLKVACSIEEKYKRTRLSGDELLITVVGSVGECAIVPTTLAGWNVARAVSVARIKENVDKQFVKYAFKTEDVKFQMYGNTNDTVQPTLNLSSLKDIKITLPSLPEQRAIASVLSSLDDKIDLLNRQNKTLEAMAETLFRQWFVEEAEVTSEKQVLLGDLIETVSVTHPLSGPQIIFLNTSDIYHGDVTNHHFESVKDLPGQAKKSIKRGDILFSEIRPANGRYAYIDFEANDYVVSTKLMVLRTKGVLGQAFVYFYLTNPKTLEWLQTLAEARSGTFPQITFDQLRDLAINAPSDELLRSSSQLCDNWLMRIKSNHAQIRVLEKMRDALLPKLMGGEVRVAGV